MSMMRWGLTLLVLSAVAASGAEAQWVRADDGWCERSWGDSERDRACFALEADFAHVGHVEVDGGANGGVQVEGWSGGEVRARARVWANAGSQERADEIAGAVTVTMRNGRLSAEGPDTGRRESWGVSWEILVPRETDLDLRTMNGGIGVTDVQGDIDFRAVNGGVHLTAVAGDVRGRTTNGGIHVELEGRRWAGQGLDVETTNGGVTMLVPTDYSARLETGTVNGGMEIDFPVMVQGRIGKRLAVTLGDGGPTVRAVTTNGGVRIERGSTAIR